MKNYFKNLFKRGSESIEKEPEKVAQGDAMNNSEGEALSIAAVQGNIDLLWNLIKKGADVNYKGYGGRTALMAAATFGYTEVARILIENGADVNAKDNENGVTILMFAAGRGHGEIVKLLIENGADLNVKDKRGRTVLDETVDPGILLMLRKAGAKDHSDGEILPAEEGVITGEVTFLDVTANSMSIKGGDGMEKAFSLIDGETIIWKGIEDIKLSDVKKGDLAEIGYYTNDAGKLVASWVELIY